jgi:hypothetical protein
MLPHGIFSSVLMIQPFSAGLFSAFAILESYSMLLPAFEEAFSVLKVDHISICSNDLALCSLVYSLCPMQALIGPTALEATRNMEYLVH